MNLKVKSDLIHKALPEGFPFYELGIVTAESAIKTTLIENSIKNCIAIGFRIYWDTDAWFIVLFQQERDKSLYTEMGNILASQFAARLSKDDDQGLVISPPQNISIFLLKKWIKTSPPITQKNYWHLFKGKTYPLQILILDADGEKNSEGDNA